MRLKNKLEALGTITLFVGKFLYQLQDGCRTNVYIIKLWNFRDLLAPNLDRMIAFRDFAGAKVAFLKAMGLCPSDDILIKNFDKLLKQTNSDALTEYRKAQILKNSY